MSGIGEDGVYVCNSHHDLDFFIQGQPQSAAVLERLRACFPALQDAQLRQQPSEFNEDTAQIRGNPVGLVMGFGSRITEFYVYDFLHPELDVGLYFRKENRKGRHAYLSDIVRQGRIRHLKQYEREEKKRYAVYPSGSTIVLVREFREDYPAAEDYAQWVASQGGRVHVLQEQGRSQ